MLRNNASAPGSAAGSAANSARAAGSRRGCRAPPGTVARARPPRRSASSSRRVRGRMNRAGSAAARNRAGSQAGATRTPRSSRPATSRARPRPPQLPLGFGQRDVEALLTGLRAFDQELERDRRLPGPGHLRPETYAPARTAGEDFVEAQMPLFAFSSMNSTKIQPSNRWTDSRCLHAVPRTWTIFQERIPATSRPSSASRLKCWSAWHSAPRASRRSIGRRQSSGHAIQAAGSPTVRVGLETLRAGRWRHRRLRTAREEMRDW